MTWRDHVKRRNLTSNAHYSYSERLTTGTKYMPLIYQTLAEEPAFLVESKVIGSNIGTRKPIFAVRCAVARGFTVVEVEDVVTHEIVAACETMDSLALPLPHRITSNCCSLDPRSGEHALLVVGAKDWCVATARWQEPAPRKAPGLARVGLRGPTIGNDQVRGNAGKCICLPLGARGAARCLVHLCVARLPSGTTSPSHDPLQHIDIPVPSCHAPRRGTQFPPCRTRAN